MISKELRFLVTHSSIYGLGTVASRVVAFILLPVYTRYLTPADYGVLEIIDISGGIIGIVITVGIARALSRFYYEFEAEKYRNRVVSTTYIIYSIVAVLSVPALYYLSDPLAEVLFGTRHYGAFFRVGFASLLFGGVLDIGLMYLRLVKRPVVFVGVTTSELTLLILFNIIFIVFLEMGIMGILCSSLIVRSVLSLVVTFLVLRKTKISFSRKVASDLIKYGLPMVPSNLANTAVKQSDKYFVLFFLSTSQMGIYSLAVKLGNAVHTLLTALFIMVYIPRRFELMKRPDAQQIYSKVFTYYIFVIGFVGLAISVLIPEILPAMVTSKFVPAGELVPLIVLNMIFFGCHYHFDFGILYSKKTQYFAYINTACAIAQIALNFLLIRSLGLFGAVYAHTIIYGVQALLLYLVSDRFYRIEFDFKRTLLFLLTAGLFYGVTSFVDTEILLLNLVIKSCLLIVFPLTLPLLGIITPEETAEIREFCRRKVKRARESKFAPRAT